MAILTKEDKYRYKMIFENLNIPMVILDSKMGNILEVNKAACEYYGYSENKLLSMNIFNINISSKEEIFKQIKETKITNKIYTRSKHKLSTGEIRDVEVYSNFLEIGDKRLIASIIHDVNEKIKLKKNYLRDKACFNILFKNSREAIAIVDKEFNVLDINDSFEKIFQYDLSEIKNKDITEKLCKTESYNDSYNFRRSVAKGKFVSEESKRYRKDGSVIDVLAMGFPLEVNGEISGAYCIYSDISESKQQENKIKTLSYKDSLTGLFNRNFFLENLRNEIIKKSDNENNKEKLALILLNINEVKEVSDALGHLMADILIKEFSLNLKKVVKNNYAIGRMTKDQLAIVIPNLKNINEVNILTTAIIESLHSSFMIDKNELYITTNIGVSFYPEDGTDFITLVRKAEIAMDRSKENNKNSVAQFQKNYDSEIQENYWIKNELIKAVESGDLFLNYQPIYDINKNQLIGVESLVRWNHKEKGIVPPLKFIPLAEKTGLINSVGEWVLREAFMQSKHWRDLGYKPLLMSINISVKQLENPNFVNLIKRIIKDTKVDPKYIQLEITETVFTNDYELIKVTIEEISKLGIKFSIDDFGTGYSSLKQLSELSINNLKIDKMFIDNVVKNTNNSKIVKAIISLAESLEISLTAEGVETEEELAFLKKNKCPTVQGYLFSKPVDSNKIENILSK